MVLENLNSSIGIFSKNNNKYSLEWSNCEFDNIFGDALDN